MPKSATDPRPLSPFMIGPYYRPQLTSMLSITHRLTGIALAVGTLFVATWVLSAAAGPEAYRQFAACAHSLVGQILLLGWSWALLYHLCNGIRHLFWDVGRGFDMKTVYAGGYAVIGVSLLATVVLWLGAYLI
jgi:succinate dehydrogenase / fumarate reductase cytochrome b subunit